MSELIGAPVRLTAQLPEQIGQVVVQGQRACVLLHSLEDEKIFLALVGATNPHMAGELAVFAAELGETLRTAHEFQSFRERLSVVLATETELSTEPSRDALAINAAAVVLRPFDDALTVLITNDGDRHVRAMAKRNDGTQRNVEVTLNAEVTNEYLCEAFRAALAKDEEVVLSDELGDALSASLLGHEAAKKFFFVPLHLDGCAHKLVGVGLPRASLAREARSNFRSANANLSAWLEEASGTEQRQVSVLLQIVAREVAASIRSALKREESFTSGAIQEKIQLGLDLHDRLLQELSHLLLKLGLLKRAIPVANTRAHAILGVLIEELKETSHEARQLSIGLTSATTPVDLVEAMRTTLSRFKRRFGGEVEFRVDGQRRQLGPKLNHQVLGVLQEALNNIWKHAGATRVLVAFSYLFGSVDLTVNDNGRGFEQAERELNHIGLRGMERRVRELGGGFTITSKVGRGSTIRAEFPG